MPKRPLPPAGPLGTCYLIHLDRKMAHAQHYIGWSGSLPARDSEHQAGNGARMLAAARQRGIAFAVVRTWEKASRRFERRLKNTANAPLLCPVCNPAGWARQVAGTGDPRPRKRQER